MDESDAQQAAPIYEAEIAIKGKITVRLEGNPENQRAILEVRFLCERDSLEPVDMIYRHPIDAPTITPERLRRFYMWGLRTRGFLEIVIPGILNGASGLMAIRASQTEVHHAGARSSLTRIIDTIIRNLRRVSGIDEEPKTGPKANDYSLREITGAMRRAAREKKSAKLLRPEDVAELLEISPRTLERILKREGTSWRKMKIEVFTKGTKLP